MGVFSVSVTRKWLKYQPTVDGNDRLHVDTSYSGERTEKQEPGVVRRENDENAECIPISTQHLCGCFVTRHDCVTKQNTTRDAKRENMSSVRNNKGQVRLKCIVLGAANAGKTSILRRYFLGTFQHGRVPTVGADFYTSRVRNPAYHEDQDEKKIVEDGTAEEGQSLWISLQMWDTAGRKRFVAKEGAKFSAALSDAFFRQANAAMMVYDATSSTSFTQLLQWHSDLMEKMKHLDKESGERRKHPFPVLIVANKMDLFKSDTAKPKRQKTAPQRDIMGLEGEFKGRDSRYEYRAARDTSDASSKPPKRREEISTYMVTGNTWTTDGSYLDSVLTTEDSSHPDRDMVLLWCMRNGLKHLEVSALDGKPLLFVGDQAGCSSLCLLLCASARLTMICITLMIGTGVNAAMEALVELALESENKKKVEEREEKALSCTTPPKAGYHEWSNQQLDLHQRYAPKEDECRCWRPFGFCRK